MRQVLSLSCGLAVLFSLIPQTIRAAVPIEDCFTTTWTTAGYDTNGGGRISSSSQTDQTFSSLRIGCEVAINDLDRVIATAAIPTITSAVDSLGHPIAPIAGRHTQPSKYTSPILFFRSVTPPALPKWRQILRSLLQIAPAGNYLVVGPALPSGFAFNLDLATLPPGEKEIRRVEGYFYALTTDSVQYVDVPFRPSNVWVRLTPSREIRVVEARSTKKGYRLRIEERHPPSAQLVPGAPLPARLVIDRQLLAENGTLWHCWGRCNTLPAWLIEEQSVSGTTVPIIRTIRYAIAVNPKHSKIPFVLKHIPLPKP